MHAVRAWVQAHPTAVGAGLVASAMVAIGVVVLVVVRSLADPLASASVAPSPSGLSSSAPTASDSGTPTPHESPAPSLGPMWHGYQLVSVETPLAYRVWARVLADRLDVRKEAGTDAVIIGTAVRGDLLMVIGDPQYSDNQEEWAPVMGNGVGGWVVASDANGAYLQPVGTPWLFGPQRVFSGLVAGDHGLLAYGAASDLAVLPYEGSGWRALVITSSDGSSWHEVPDLGGPASAATAGSGQYVLAFTPTHIEPNLVRVSADGEHWLDSDTLSFLPSAAAWGPTGAVLVGSDQGAAVVARFRSDATVQETQLPATDGISEAGIEGSSAGYVAFDRYNYPSLFVSTDGATWKTVSIPGVEQFTYSVRDVELDGAQLIVVLVDTGSGATSLRFGRLDGDGGVAWETGQSAPFGSATVDSITLGGGTYLALGWDRADLVPRVWRSNDGHAWTDLGVDARTFGGAIGPEPVFTGGRWYAATDAIYASDDGATWEEVFRPSLPPIQAPGCPPADEVTTLDLVFLGGLAADCYGDTPLELTAWITVPEGLGGCCSPIGEPAWLNAWIPPGFLSSGDPDGAFGNATLNVYPVSAVLDEFQTQGWARITGHFHDPAAAECRSIPLSDLPQRLEARAMIVTECERHFVVDGVVRIGS